MKKLLIYFSLILVVFLPSVFANIATAQTTTVTVTVTDKAGIVWTNGTILYSFKRNSSFSGQYQWQNAALPNSYLTPAKVQLDNTGSATFTLPTSTTITPSGSSWTFQVCPNASSQCQTFAVPTAGTTQNLSSYLIPNGISVYINPIPIAMTDNQISTVPAQGGIYYNVQSAPGLRFWDGSAFQALASAGGIFPTGTGIVGVNSGNPFLALSSNIQSAIGSQVIYANVLAGADPGAKINAADVLLGSSPGYIVYDATSAGTVSTVITLNSNHNLLLQSALTWPGGTYINLPTSSSGQVISCPAVQTFSSGSFIQGISVSNIQITGCNISGPSSEAGLPNLAFFTASNYVQINNNTLTNVNLLYTASTAAYGTCPGGSCQYPNVNSSNSNNNFKLLNNTGTATVGNNAAFILTFYVNNVTISNNRAYGYASGIQWFGGDACVGSGCSVGGNGSFSNPPKSVNYLISDNDIQASGSCIWGSMGQYMTIDNNQCNASATSGSDVGIDLEGTWDSIISNNQVGYNTPFQNGQLTTFFLATRNKWIGNKIYTAGSTINLNNATFAPGGLIETFQSNDIYCTASTACGMGIQATDTVNFWDNNLTNTEITINSATYSQLNVERNTLTFSVATPNGIDLENFNNGSFGFGQAVVRSNKVYTTISQSSGVDGIKVVGSDYNNIQQAFIENNIMSWNGVGNWPTDIYVYAASANSASQYLTVDIRNNSLSSNTIVTGAASTTTIYARTVGNYGSRIGANQTVIYPNNVSSNTVVPLSSSASGQFVQYIDSSGVQHLGTPSIISPTYSTAPTGTCIAGTIVAGDFVVAQDGTQAVCGSGSTGWVQVNCMAAPLPWTPVDVSGAELTFTSVSAKYYRCGKQVTVVINVTYPTTTDTHTTMIGGLPFPTYNSGPSFALIGSCVTSSVGMPQQNAGASTGTSQFSFYTNGINQTNATYSGVSLFCSFSYFTN